MKILSIILLSSTLIACGKKKTTIINYDDAALKSDLQSRLSDMQAMIDTSNTQISDLNDELSSLEREMQALDARMLEIENNVQVLDIIDPCGDAVNIVDEVIFKVAHLGEVKYFASFSENSSGKNTRLSLLNSGDYITTDGSNCRFSIE